MDLTRIFKKIGERFGDGLINEPLRIGTGSTFNASGYAPTLTTFTRQQLEWAYQSSWVCALMVDLLAVDMTRAGIEIKDQDPAKAKTLERVLQRYRLWSQLADCLKWARLFGGSLGVILIDGDDMSLPLSQVRQGTFKGIHVLDRWQVQPSFEKVQTLGVDFGQPEYYELIDGSNDIQVPGNKIHHSRVMRFTGRQMPYYLRKMYMGWGSSILEPIFDRVKAFDLATTGAAQLISKAYLRYYKVKGFREILTNDLARRGFMAQMEEIRKFQSIEGLTIGDTEDDFQVFNYTFTGLPELLIQFGQQISGACGIPLVRLFGQSPAGLNSTGESDFRNYYDNVRHEQQLNLRPALERLLSVIYQSEFGEKPSAEFDFDFVSLWQLTSEQKAAAAQAQSGAIISALSAGAISTSVALKELKALSGQLGVFASISDEDIAEAEEQDNGMMPPMPEEEVYGSEGEQIQGSNEDGPASQVVRETLEENLEGGRSDR